MNKRLGEAGEFNILLIPVILLAVLFITAGSFAFWAFNGRQDYKNNVDAKVQSAVSANTKTVQSTDAEQYAEVAKQPFKTYTGPEQYGSVRLSYPKTWSGYVDTTDSNTPLDAYFYPDVVPATTDQTASFALRVQITTQTYSQTVASFNSSLKLGKVTVAPYTLAKVPGIVGILVQGQIETDRQGSMVILPLRDKTVKLWTESSNFTADFNNTILPNFSFSP